MVSIVVNIKLNPPTESPRRETLRRRKDKRIVGYKVYKLRVQLKTEHIKTTRYAVLNLR